MAIWDKKVETTTVPDGVADSHKCLSCGGILIYNLKEGALVCSTCDSKFYPELFDVTELLESIHESELKPEDDGKHEIVCNSCGAVVVTEKNTFSTFCAFCGSPAVVTRSLSKGFNPDYIIPFKTNEEDVRAMVQEWAENRKYLPSDFFSKSKITKLTGMYVPFWLVDANCKFDIVGGGAIRHNEGKLFTSSFYEVKRKGTFKMRRVPFDGSIRISDRMMEAIEPFDYSEMVPYNIGYLQGCYAERYELTVDDMANRITTRFRDYMYDAAVNHMNIGQYNEFNIEEDNSIAEDYSIKYALLPVWFACIKYRGKFYRIVVNGQTGEVAGTTPTRDLEIRRRRAARSVAGYIKAFLMALAVAVLPAVAFALLAKGFLSFIMPMGMAWYGQREITILELFIKSYAVVAAILVLRTILNIFGIGFFGFGKNVDSLIQDDIFMIRGEVAAYGNDANVLDPMPPVYQYIESDEELEFESVDREIF